MKPHEKDCPDPETVREEYAPADRAEKKQKPNPKKITEYLDNPK